MATSIIKQNLWDVKYLDPNLPLQRILNQIKQS
jgi:hypothetical protein